MDYKSCGQFKTDKIIVVEENKKKFIIENPQQKMVHQVKVDGCLIPKHDVKCDYLFELREIENKTQTIKRVFYVELKGKDIKHAYEQIIATVEVCKNVHKDALRECHIVSSSPNVTTQEFQLLEKGLKKKYGKDIKLFKLANQKSVMV